jgi:hypothetical protein
MGKPSLSNSTLASYFFFLGFCFFFFFFFGSFYTFFGGGLTSFYTFFSFVRLLDSPVQSPDLKSLSLATLDRVWQTAGGVYSLLDCCCVEVCNYMFGKKEIKYSI